MRIIISDSSNELIATLTVRDGDVAVEGDFPGGLTAQDLKELGFVYYETDERGDIVARVKDVPPAESLAYVRAVLDALPPGFHVAHVDSPLIEAERRAKRQRFEQELNHLVQEG